MVVLLFTVQIKDSKKVVKFVLLRIYLDYKMKDWHFVVPKAGYLCNWIEFFDVLPFVSAFCKRNLPKKPILEKICQACLKLSWFAEF